MKYYLLIIVMTGIFCTAVACFQNNKVSKTAEFKPDRTTAQVRVTDTAPSDWKTYTNTQLGISFQYPDTWSKYNADVSVGDQSGNLAGVNINFADTASSTTLLVEYRLGPNGSDLYKYALSQFNSSQGWYATGAKQITVAGSKAIEAFTTISVNGKGNPINPPLRLILIDFLNPQQTAAIELQFKTPLADDSTEVTKFKQLVSTFKFSH